MCSMFFDCVLHDVSVWVLRARRVQLHLFSAGFTTSCQRSGSEGVSFIYRRVFTECADDNPARPSEDLLHQLQGP